MEKKIRITKNGPYVVSGLPLAKEIVVCDKDGTPLKWKKGRKYPSKKNYALCRCGRSDEKPFCDGTHAKIGFDGTETASNKKYLKQAKRQDGPNLVLTDAEELCSSAIFCHRADGVWNLVENSDTPEAKRIAIEEACDCPSGRLVVYNKKNGKAIEPKFTKSISIIEDPGEGVSGPLWVKGGVKIERSDGKICEYRNRVTLCKCGKSENKPFCDGTHVDIRFNDGDETVNK